MKIQSTLWAIPILVVAAAAFQGCGGGDDGGDDFADIKATATAAAQRSPSPEATVDLVKAYYVQASALAKELADLTNTLDADMLGAQASQGDPKWPPVLTADADLVIAKANALNTLAVPAGVPPTLAGRVGGAAQGLAAGANLLKQAILKLDPAIGAEAAATLDNAENLLDSVRAELDAAKGP